jgi:hypothetical protein
LGPWHAPPPQPPIAPSAGLTVAGAAPGAGVVVAAAWPC